MENSDHYRIPAIALDAADRNRWAAEAKALTFPEHPAGFHEFQQRARELASRYANEDVLQAIWLLQEHELAAAVFSGLPLDADRGRPDRKRAVSEAALVGMMSLIGEIYGFRQDRTGPLIHQIAPLPDCTSENSADGSGTFGMHVGKSVFPAESRPEWLGLYGPVNDSRVAINLVFWDDVLRFPTRGERADLEREEFQFPQTGTLDFGKGCITSGPAAVIEPWHDGRWAGRFAEYSTQAMTPRARDALESLRSAIRQAERHSVEILPGTLLILDNTRVLHGCGSFSGRRWLQRAYVHSEVDGMRQLCGALPDEHVFDARLLLLG